MNRTCQILVEKNRGVLMLGINRPEKKNALSVEMYHGLTEALISARSDDTVRAVLIHGGDEAFCAGNDLGDFNNRKSGVKSPAEKLLHTLNEFEKPVVAAVSGIAIGIGVTMLLHCDLVYAASGTRFRMPFVNLGVIPEGGTTLLFPLLAGYRKAAEVFMLGEFFEARDAVELGIVNRSVPCDTLMDLALDKAEYLAGQPQHALLTTKQMMKQALQGEIRERIENECALFGEFLKSEASIAARERLKKKNRSVQGEG